MEDVALQLHLELWAETRLFSSNFATTGLKVLMNELYIC